MKIAYFDLIAGASGDMLLGALLDAGLALDDLRAGLAGLHLAGFSLAASRVMRGPFAAMKLDVEISDTVTARRLSDIQAIISASELPASVRTRSLHVFERMVSVEAGIHQAAVEHVHLHELGALDTIADVTGFFLGLHIMGIEQVVVSPVPLGRGVIVGAHGRIPLPAPATVALLSGVPVVGVEHSVETVTPTAAALLTEAAASFGVIPAMTLTAVGYGAGGRLAPEPNVLRVLIGETEADGEHELSTLDMIETNIDDMNPEWHGYLIERLLADGALDVYLTPIVMKKNRPAILLSVLCRPHDTARLRDVVAAETTTLGMRVQQVKRYALPRISITVETPYGPVRVKVAGAGSAPKAAPEYEDCRRIAQQSKIPLRVVYEAAWAAWRAGNEPSGGGKLQ